MTTALWLLAVLLVGIGLAGTVLPALPGTVFVFGGLLLAAWLDDFGKVGILTVLVLGVLTVVSLAVDFAAGVLGAQRAGASRSALIGAAVGTLAGLPFGIVGLIAGPFAGALIGEFAARRDPVHAGKVGFAAWLGFLVGSVLKIALAFTMVAVFALAYFL